MTERVFFVPCEGHTTFGLGASCPYLVMRKIISSHDYDA